MTNEARLELALEVAKAEAALAKAQLAQVKFELQDAKKRIDQLAGQ